MRSDYSDRDKRISGRTIAIIGHLVGFIAPCGYKEAVMEEETLEEVRGKTHEVWQGLFGVRGTGDGGLIGDVREIKSQIKILNSQVKGNTAFRKLCIWIGVPLLAAVIAALGFAFWGG